MPRGATDNRLRLTCPRIKLLSLEEFGRIYCMDGSKPHPSTESRIYEEKLFIIQVASA